MTSAEHLEHCRKRRDVRISRRQIAEGWVRGIADWPPAVVSKRDKHGGITYYNAWHPMSTQIRRKRA